MRAMTKPRYATTFLVGLACGAGLLELGYPVAGHAPTAMAADRPGIAVDQTDAACPERTLEHNRQLVHTFFAPARSPLEAYNLMTPDYVQHDEGVKRFGKINGLSDREAFKAIDEILTKSAQRPELLVEAGRPTNEMAFKIIATCDYVVAMHRTHVPDPQKKGAFYPAFDFELWRINGGKFAEHWDSQRIPTPLPELMLKPITK